MDRDLEKVASPSDLQCYSEEGSSNFCLGEGEPGPAFVRNVDGRKSL